MLSKRIKKLNSSEDYSGDNVVYVMSRDQRVVDNHAVIAAQEFSLKHGKPLVVVFNAFTKLSVRIHQQFRFMYDGLLEVQKELNKLNIPFLIKEGRLIDNIDYIDEKLKPTAVLFDFSPLRNSKNEKVKIAKTADYPVFVVDTHNVVPVWIASNKQEYAARTIRPKIHKNLEEFLVEPKKIKKQSRKLSIDGFETDIEKVFKKIDAKKVKDYKIGFTSGTKAGLEMMEDFIENRLNDYDEDRNDPTIEGLSNMSPYLHFGQVSSLRVALEVKDSKVSQKAKDAYLEELIVRKELSDNYVFYNDNYDNFNGLADWAKDTLNDHRDDEREYVYSRDEFEQAETHDMAWNAAQVQMMRTGKMHGYMRMYWAKKILEWTDSPEDAIEIAIYLNDKYSIDGLDPNGYTGIMWSIGGIHDRGWAEREVFGKVRYMNFNGLKRKFDIKSYISNWLSN